MLQSTDVASAHARPNPTRIYQSFLDIFDLHRALMPVAHLEVLQNVPALAMQFANDCQYLARELEGIEKRSKGVVLPALEVRGKRKGKSGTAEGGEIGLAEQARLMTALGRKWFDAQMVCSILAFCRIRKRVSLLNQDFSCFLSKRYPERW